MSGSLSVTFSNFGKLWNYTKNFAEVMPELVLGNGSEKLGEAIRTTNGSIFTKAEAGWKALKEAGKGDFFKGLWKNLKDFFPSIKDSCKAAVEAAEASGKNTFTAGVKDVFKSLGKKMPFIASASMILFELPTIFKATAEQGIFQGGAEVVKATARLTVASIGAAIGSAVIPIPFVGSMAGWIAGEWLTSKIVGDSYSVQKAEKEEEMKKMQEQFQQAVQNQQVTNAPDQNVNPFWLNNQQATQNPVVPQVPSAPAMPGINPQFNGMYNPFAVQTEPYANDIMKQQMNFNQFA